MICPHCSTAVKFEWKVEGPIKRTEEWKGYFLIYDNCPNCDETVVYYSLCEFEEKPWGGLGLINDEKGNFKIDTQILIYPNKSNFHFSQYIPKKYYTDYEESLKVLSASPKASAALSRRLLQYIIRDEYKIKKKSLNAEIEEFILLSGIPTHLTDAIDAVRNIGNFAAHPTKDKNTGEIVNVEPGEAEWLIEVIEAFFDFTFVQPMKIEQRRIELNKKLEKLGKPPLKNKN